MTDKAAFRMAFAWMLCMMFGAFAALWAGESAGIWSIMRPPLDFDLAITLTLLAICAGRIAFLESRR